MVFGDPPDRHGDQVLSVFIADDNDQLRMLLGLLLQAEPGFECIGEAATGPAAMQAISQGVAPDILLLDVNMPMHDARTQLRRLRELHPDMQVVLYSGEDEAEGRHRAGDIGECQYVVKGRPEDLIEALREAVPSA